jgi:hypothetical protein
MPFQATVVQKKLEEAGFETKLAYGLASVCETEVVGEFENRFVTKEYLDAKLAELKVDMIKWMAGMIGVRHSRSSSPCCGL